MSLKFIARLVSFSLIANALSACQTIGSASMPLPSGFSTAPPPGYAALCRRDPSECALPLTKENNQLLEDMHFVSKDLVVPTWEEEGGDYWQSLSERGPGDCEDFALTLRRKLRQVLPDYAGAFRLATVYTETMQYHAILTIETTQGTVVCDIRFPQCAAWETFPYKWHLREVAGQTEWEDISYTSTRINQTEGIVSD